MLAKAGTDRQIMARLTFMKTDARFQILPKPTLWNRFGVASQFSEILQGRWMETRPVSPASVYPIAKLIACYTVRKAKASWWSRELSLR